MATKFNWDMTTWETKELLQWVYAISERSDRVINQAMLDDDWSDYEDDERIYAKLTEALRLRGLYTSGEPINPEVKDDSSSSTD